MNAEQVIEELKKYPPQKEVRVQSDRAFEDDAHRRRDGEVAYSVRDEGSYILIRSR